MPITAKIIKDSIARTRITTLQLRYPRFIHAQFMTHRVFSRSASSSRAIPVSKMIQEVLADPVYPMHWGKNQKGMQAHTELDNTQGKEYWEAAMYHACNAAEAMSQAGYHKQISNRLIEPFSHISVVCTGTDWDNFFELRLHEDAQPEMQMLAQQIAGALEESEPTRLHAGEWHLPYAHADEFGDPRLISAARCARVSYLKHDGTTPDATSDMELANKLLQSRHMSPFEHQAVPTGGRWANFNGWRQYRSYLE